MVAVKAVRMRKIRTSRVECTDAFTHRCGQACPAAAVLLEPPVGQQVSCRHDACVRDAVPACRRARNGVCAPETVLAASDSFVPSQDFSEGPVIARIARIRIVT
jgi:hypothetical protein